VSAAYRRGLDERRGIERVRIEAARPLDEETRAAVLGAWTAYRRSADPRLSRITATESVDPGLLGGFRLEAGSIRYDASVSGRLRRLGKELAKPLDRPAAGSGGPA
ncbi:MAG: F0F1 ATP synthase subunit delta, partial [Spirochaetes bacterium]|nr:F0F1 ATP synthase subunit delta [Spirochaetota bacterium]